jgi:hypothetical protein
MRLGRQLEVFNLAFVEDPVLTQDTEAHARVRQALDTLALTGENVMQPNQLKAFLQAGPLDIAAPDVAGYSRIFAHIRYGATLSRIPTVLVHLWRSFRWWFVQASLLTQCRPLAEKY